MEKSPHYLFTLLFAALAFFARAQSVDNVVVTPNPAYSNTPVTVTMQGQLFSSCDYLANVTTTWSGTTLNVYMDFNETSGFCMWIVTDYEYPVAVGTLSPNNYTVRVWDADSGTLMFTQYFTVSSGSNANGCGNPALVSCGNTYPGNNANGSNAYLAYTYNGSTYSGYTGPEMVYRFTTNAAGPVNIQLTGLSADLDLFLLNACNPSNVIAVSGNWNNQSEQISVNLNAGTYYIIVDGWSGSVSNYSLSLQCSGGGEGQNSCSNPYIVQCGGSYQYSNSVGTNNYSTWYFGGVPHSNMTGKETIHRLTLNNYTNLTLTLTGLSADLDLYLFSACNNTSGLYFSENGSNQNEIIQVNNLAPGTYYVIVDGFYGATSNYSLSVQCLASASCQPPATSQLSVTNLTPTTAQLNCSVTGVQTYFWRYRAVGSGNWNLWGQTTVPYINVTGLNPNTFYEFQVQVRCLNGFISDWSASQTFTTPGGGLNSCSYPALLTCGATFPYNNSLGSNHASTYKIGNGYIYGYSGSDVIHKFTINTTSNVTLNLSGLSANLALIVLNACNANNGIAYSDNAGNYGEIINLNSLPAGTYYVIVDSKASYIHSNYSLQLTCNGIIIPTNDEPCGATNVAVNTSCVYSTLTTVNATQTVNPPASQIGCSTTGMKDIWVRLTIPSTGAMAISTQAGSLTDLVMAGYYGSNCNAMIYFFCRDDYNGNPMPQVTITGSPGTNIWLRLWGKNGAIGTFYLCAQTASGLQANNDGSDNIIVDALGEEPITDRSEETGEESILSETTTLATSLRIYPVPATDYVTIAMEAPASDAETVLRIFDANGRLVREQTGMNVETGEFSTTLDISDLPRGTYAVVVQTGEKMLNGRLIKVE